MASITHCHAAMLLLCAGAAIGNAATIEVVIPATAPSRPAHFNWEFESASGQPVRTGQFACGSYWVAPAVGDVAVRFISLSGHPGWNDLLTCDADPTPGQHGLLSGANQYGSHDSSRNLLPQLPKAFEPRANACISLVAAMQRNEAETSAAGTRLILGEAMDAMCVVTVMPDAPANAGRGMIRPNFVGLQKEFLTWDDFDLSRLPDHDFIKGRPEHGWADSQRRWAHSTEVFSLPVERKTRDGMRFQQFSEGGRAFRSHLLISNYASGKSAAFNGDLMAMFTPENTLEEKRPALAAMLAYGLDTYHARYNHGNGPRVGWASGAGQAVGQFMPAVFAAALLKDESKADVLKMAAVTRHDVDRAGHGPQELRQIRRGVTGVLLWGDGHPIIRDGNTMVEQDWRYWADFSASKCYDSYEGEKKPNPNVGRKTAADPYGYIDGPANQPGSAYMSVSFGQYRAFAAIMILMPEIRSIVNSDDPIEYVDRVTRHGLWTWPDPVAPPAKLDQDSARLWWRAENVQEWGKTWGVRPDDIRFAIENGEGRFRSMHGTPLHAVRSYETATALSNWGRIIAMYDGPRFEDRIVAPEATVAPDILVAPAGEQFVVHFDCPNPDAVIYYTIDGSDPTRQSLAYAGQQLSIHHAVHEIRAMAEAPGKAPSAVHTRAIARDRH